MDHSQEQRFDDIFICISDIFVIAAAAYALQRLQSDVYYSFAVVVPQKKQNDPYERLIGRLGGVVLDDASLSKSPTGCTRLLIHSFGRMDWQLAKFEKIAHAKVGIYSDFLKNDYHEAGIEKVGATSIIFFGWIFAKPGLREIPEIETTRFRFCFQIYLLLMREFDVPRLELRPGLTKDNSALIFLRYWGSGVYRLRDGVMLGDAVRQGIVENRGVTLYVKGDPRISKEHYASVKPKLEEAGYVVKPLHEMFADADAASTLDQMPAELLLDALAGSAFRAYVYDSSLCFALQMRAGAQVMFPTKEQIEGVFADDAGARTVLVFAHRYKRICDLIAQDGRTEVIHEIRS